MGLARGDLRAVVGKAKKLWDVGEKREIPLWPREPGSAPTLGVAERIWGAAPLSP